MAIRPPPDERTIDELRTFGVVNLDKPPGPSSHQVAAWVRDLLGVEKASHAGTLDPKVTGCLPLLVGDATRIARAFLEGSKEYVAVLELHRPPPADLDDVIAEFVGPLYQKPPRKSAVSRRLRVREIYDIEVLEVVGRKALLRIECESGTYVRKLCHDVGLALGIGGHMGDLRRTGTVPFDDTTLVSLHDLADAIAYAEAGETEQLHELLEPAERALEHLPRVIIAETAAAQVAHGAPVYAPGVISSDVRDHDGEPLVACYTVDGSAVSLGRLVGDPHADGGTVVDLERVLV